MPSPKQFEIRCGDVVKELDGIADASIPLVVTSPPYNIGKEYETNRPLVEYLDWCSSWIEGIAAKLTAGGSFWLNLGYLSILGRGRAVPLSYLLWDRVPLYLVQEVVWHYGAGVAAKRSFSPRNEKWLWYVKSPDDYIFNLDDVRDPNVKYPNQKKNGKLKCNPLGKNPTDVWEVPKVTSGTGRASAERTRHPAQFPVAVIDRIVRACSMPNDVVLDPFSGSGSTGVAAIAAGRRFVGIEIRRDYCEIAERRLASTAEGPAQLSLDV